MRKVLAGVVLVVALLAAAVWALGVRTPGDDAESAAASPSAADAKRGEYLARAGNCMTCHTERGGAAYAGGRAIHTPFGTVFASNLTPDRETGLGEWTPADFWRALHHGKSRDGRLLSPAFPYNYYTEVTRADADALYAYLRTLPPVKRANRAHELRWPYSSQAALAVWRAMYFRPGVYERVAAKDDTWNRGAYLVRGLGHCGACHTARNVLGASADLMDFSGGLIPMQNWYAPSLASPTEAGVADWPVADIAQLLRDGASPRGTVLGPMAEVVLNSTQHLSAGDLEAMAVFLKSLPVAATQAAPSEVPRAAEPVARRGEKLYGDHCASCHGDRGEGVRDAYPALAGNRAVTLPATANLVQIVMFGGYPPSTQGNPRPHGMPPFAMLLNDADAAALLTYIRGAWGNKAMPVSELEVVKQRGSTQ
ncbi:c-type cytochrome [Ramlibacter sp.]|uniref:c-type cytochrome n=1 Tax=Ramlibacter sp. TaxID=1917967 RepID=UPI003D0CD5D5